MAHLAAGDVTTQMTLWIKANVADKDIHKGCKASLATATTLPATTDMTTLWATWVGR
jgi:hypothetical protein